mgnify:CR=1 FL=1
MLTLLTTTGAEPVTVAEARLAARFDGTVELDSFIEGAISAARREAEQFTGRLYRPQQFRAELASWPAADELIHVYRPTVCAVSYWAGSDFVALDTGAYEYAAQGPGTLLAPALGSNWPTLADKAIGPRVRIDLTGGIADPDEVPECVKLYIKAHVAAWLDTPAAQRVSQQLNPNPLFACLLDSERLWC